MAAFYYYLAQTRSPAASGSGNVCKAKVSIIAHRLGHFLIQVARFQFWKRINSPLGLSLVNQLLTVAVDVGNDLFDTATLTLPRRTYTGRTSTRCPSFV